MLRVSDEPKLASMIDERERPMASAWLRCERLGGWFVGLGVLAAMLFAAVVTVSQFERRLGVTLFSGGIILVVAAPFLWYQITYLALRYRSMSWLAAPDRIELRKGVWWRKVITVPKRNVQHTDVTQGPLQRRFGIASLVIHTAGTQYAKVEIPGLAHADASALRDWLIDAKRKQDAGS